jgi:hypothetical protein
MTHNILSLLSLLALAGCGQAPAGAAAQPRPVKPLVVGTPAAPVVVELFQSQGCSSDAPGVLALSFAVTYWDRLGWKDTFGSPAWTARQWDYARAAGRPQVATPQVIINGGPTIVGSNRAQLEAAIQRAGPARGGPAISVRNGALTLAAGKDVPSTIWLVRYDPRTVEVPIRAGENGGRTLPHRNIVRELVKLGNWSGAVTELPLPSAPRGLSSAVLVQQGTGGPITAARKL